MCSQQETLRWEVFDLWLGEEENVARVTRLEVLLTSNATPTTSEPQKTGPARLPTTKLINATQAHEEEEEEEQQVSCATSPGFSTWDLFSSKEKQKQKDWRNVLCVI